MEISQELLEQSKLYEKLRVKISLLKIFRIEFTPILKGEETTSTSGDHTLVEENEPEVVDVSRMSFVESAEVRMDELHQFRERSSSL